MHSASEPQRSLRVSFSLRRTFCASLVVTFAVLNLLAETSAVAMLLPQGKVQVNGVPAPRNVALFTGDTIQTAEGSVVISTAGTTVSVPAHSSLAMGAKAVHLASGGVIVNTTAGMSVRTETLLIEPVGESATFKIVSTDGLVEVLAQRGGVAVSGTARATLAEGQTASFRTQESSGTTAADENERRKWHRRTAIAYWGSMSGGAMFAYFGSQGDRSLAEGKSSGREAISPVQP